LTPLRKEWSSVAAGAAEPRRGQRLAAGCSTGELRSFVTLAYLDELLEEPQLLADYVSMVSDEDDATLAVSAAGLGQDLAVKAIASASDGAGLAIGGLLPAEGHRPRLRRYDTARLP
jgi:hypothetical protein